VSSNTVDITPVPHNVLFLCENHIYYPWGFAFMVDGFVVHATFLLRIQRSITGKNFARKIEDKNLSWAIIRGEKQSLRWANAGAKMP